MDNNQETIETLLAQRAAIDSELSKLRRTEARDAIERYFPDVFSSFVRYLRLHNVALVYHGGHLLSYRVPTDLELQIGVNVREAWPEEHGFSEAFRNKISQTVLDQLFDAAEPIRRGCHDRMQG